MCNWCKRANLEKFFASFLITIVAHLAVEKWEVVEQLINANRRLVVQHGEQNLEKVVKLT